MAGKNTRPALIQPCNSTEDHPKHHWVPDFAGRWPKGTFWHCRGYNRAEAEAGARNTARAIKHANKNR